MSRIEEDLRAVLTERFEEGMGAPPPAMPARLRRRVRIRQARGVIAVTVMAGAIGTALFVGLRPFQPSSTRPSTGVIEPTPSPTFFREEGVQAYVLARNDSKSPWKFLAFSSRGRGVCLAVHRETSRSTATACQFTVPEDRALESNSYDVADRPPGSLSIVFGAVTPAATEVAIRLDGGRTIRAQIVLLPDALATPFNAFLAEVPSEAEGDIMVFDSGGRILAMEPLGPPPPNFQPGDRIPVLDSYGNAIGDLPYDYLMGANTPDGEWIPPGSRAPIDSIRNMALSPLKVRAELRDWWKRRPDPSALDADFFRWWNSYPYDREVPDPPSP